MYGFYGPWGSHRSDRKGKVYTDEEDHVSEWVHDGIIELAKNVLHYTEPSAPPKKDDQGKKTERRLCVNFKALNKITEKDPYEMPRADDCMRLREGKYFTKIDMKAGFWQVDLAYGDRYKTAFRIGDEFYQWRCMPMGMKNSPMTFQRLIDDALEGIKGIYCYGYLDDIIVFSETWSDHLKHVSEVMKRLTQLGRRTGDLLRFHFSAGSDGDRPRKN